MARMTIRRYEMETGSVATLEKNFNAPMNLTHRYRDVTRAAPTTPIQALTPAS